MVNPCFLKILCVQKYKYCTDIKQNDYCILYEVCIQIAGQGLEPRYTAPKTVVLPLDDPAETYQLYHIILYLNLLSLKLIDIKSKIERIKQIK